jgi:hypothetical protein
MWWISNSIVSKYFILVRACVHGESPDSCDNFFDIDDLCDNFFNIDGYLTPLKPQPEFKGNVVGWFAA